MFTTFKRLNKFLASLLVVLLLISNSVALVPVHAAASTNTYGQTRELPAITLDQELEDPAQNKLNTELDNLTTKQKTVQLLNQLIPHYAENGKQQGPEWLRPIELNLTLAEDFKPLYSLETIQPFTKEIVDGRLGFWQGRYAHQSGANNTANLGVGLRWLSEDKTSITGINGFYDYAFKHDLSRLGFGAEYFNRQAEYRANFYIPTSGDRLTGTTTHADGMLYSYIRAVGGFDFEAGTSLANAPWLSFYASGFQYDNKHKADENGYKLRSKMQLTPKLSMEMGYSNSNQTDGGLFGKVLFQLADAAGPAWRGGNAEATSNDISYKLVQKVQRENDIKTETFTKLVAYTGELGVTVTNTNGAALQGARVQAYQNGSPVGAAAITDANGSAVLSGLAAGDYIVRADYFSVNGTSPAVTVQKDQPANTAVSLAVVGGMAIVNVLDNAGAGIGGATVTAEAAGAAGKSSFGVKTAYAAAAFAVTAATDANGIARFNNLPSGNYKFTVTDSGKEMKSLAVAVTDGSTSNATIVLPASGGNIVAMISDAVSEAVISGATVELKNGSSVIDKKTTGSDGTAVFSGLTAGSTYTVTASATNYSGKSMDITVADKETVAAKIALTPQGGGATITVKDNANAPLSGVTVSVTVNGQEQTATTATNGEATFTNIPTGTYTFTATKSGYDSGTSAVTIASGETATATIAMTPQTGSAIIDVSDGVSKALSGATVSVTVNGTELTAKTDDKGKATFNDIPTGRYSFTATLEGWGSESINVTIANKETATTYIFLTRQVGDARITVTDGTDPVKDVTVSVTVNGQSLIAFTDTNGVATFENLPTGTYTFTASMDGYNSVTKDVTITSGKTETATIDLTRPTGSVTFRVTDETNTVIHSNATVSVMANGNKLEKTTDSNGKVTFTGLPTGTYTFTITKPWYRDETATVTIEADKEATATVALIQLANLNITVTDNLNTPLSGATVRVTGNGQDITVQTDEQGKATFSQIPAGDYTYTVTKEGYSSYTRNSISIIGITGDTVYLTRQKGSIALKVTDGTNPIKDATVRLTVNGQEQTAKTNDFGDASFTNLPTGTYTFTASMDGYDSGTTDVTIISETTETATIALARKMITAQVNVKDGELDVWGASVRVTGNGVDQTATTNYLGNATFSLPAGTYTFTVTCNNYHSYSENILISDETSSVNVTMVHKVGDLTLIVKDSKGQPISGATIGEAYSDIVYGTTNTDGEFTLEDVPTNVKTQMYYYIVKKDGYQGMIQGVEVNEGTNEQEVVLKRLPGKAKVTVKSGTTALQGATVMMEDGSSKTTNVYGYTTFSPVPGGEVVFTAGMPGYASKTVTATIAPGSEYSDPYTQVEITLTPLDPATLVTLTVNSNYDPAEMNVVFYLRDENGFDIAASSKTGCQMIFSGLAPNSTYTIIGKKDGVYNKAYDLDVNMGSTNKTVEYNKFQ